EALTTALARLGRLDLAILGRGRGHERSEQPGGCLGDFLDRALERVLIRLRRLRESADLADVLQRRAANFFFGRLRLEVVQRADVATHWGLLRFGSRPD